MAIELQKSEDQKTRIRALRGMLRRFEQVAAENARPLAVPTGFDALDEVLPRRGFLCGGISEVTGPEGCGRLTVVLRAAAEVTRGGRLVALVDARGSFYPPAARRLGVDLARLCVVRPPEGERAAWATEQLVRSGCFALVALFPQRRLSPVQAERLRRAAAGGGAALVVVGGAELGARSPLPSDLSLAVQAGAGGALAVTVLRARGAAPGRTVEVDAPDRVDRDERPLDAPPPERPAELAQRAPLLLLEAASS